MVLIQYRAICEGGKMKLLGFTPDIEENTPNAVLAAANIIPTTKGISGSKTLINMNWDNIEGVHSATTVQLLGDVKRTFLSNTANIYEVVNGAKTGVFTSVEPITHTNVVSFGNMSVASTGGATKLLSALEGLPFTEITEAPKAKIIDVVSGFIMALNYSTIPNGWYSSGIQNPLEWTTGTSTQSANGILYQTGGAITAGRAINDRMIAFKETSTYAADYVGGDVIWQWTVLSESVGCAGINAVAKTPQGLVFVSNSNIHLFNGNAITDIGSPVNTFFTNDRDENQLKNVQVSYSFLDKLVYIHYQSSAGVMKSLVLNMDTNQWGIISDFGIGSVKPIGILQYVKGGISCDELTGTGDDLVGGVDNSLWFDNSLVTTYIGSDGDTYSLTGSSSEATLKFNVFGDHATLTTLNKVTPQWVTKPVMATSTHWFNNSNSLLMTKGKDASLFMNNFNHRKCAYYHQVEVKINGDFELYDLKYQFINNEVIR